MSTYHQYDCLIVGGRVAGAATAVLLARSGHRVLLADRASRLGPTLSTHVFGDWEAFEPLGVAADLAAAGAPPMRRFRTDVAGCVTEADLMVTPYVLGLRRERLDPLLVARARSFPEVEWLPGHPVTQLCRDETGRVTGAVLRTPEGGRRVTAKVVIGADGRDSLVAGQAAAETYLSRPAVRCAYYGYYRDLAAAPVPAFEYYWAGENLVLLAACDDDLHCVCVMPPEEEFGRWRRDRERLFTEVLAGIPTLAPRLAGATRAGRLRGTRRLESYLRTPHGPGWALVGDAGAAVHPCIGAGIDHAVASARMLASALHDHLSGDLDWDSAMSRYHRERDARVRPTLEAALRLAGRRPVQAADTRWLRLLMTLPGMSHDLGEKVPEVIRAIAGEGMVERLHPLLDGAEPPIEHPFPTAVPAHAAVEPEPTPAGGPASDVSASAPPAAAAAPATHSDLRPITAAARPGRGRLSAGNGFPEPRQGHRSNVPPRL
ncbi:FAD-dependent oxidoreductase [Actinomadura sp. 3N407]|uniref:FAD-dependent oxidoreductase n=1 Tax=Actinomadura sp. 3N407 TaxID=3457423 RepID=UPI003FCE559B